jgi:hypothetical protein
MRWVKKSSRLQKFIILARNCAGKFTLFWLITGLCKVPVSILRNVRGGSKIVMKFFSRIVSGGRLEVFLLFAVIQ